MSPKWGLEASRGPLGSTTLGEWQTQQGPWQVDTLPGIDQEGFLLPRQQPSQ